MPIPRHTVTLLDKKEIASNTLELRFSKPADFNFIAGQFVQVIVPHEPREINRSYSLSSSPTDDHLELCVKMLPDGVGSNYFKKLEIAGEAIFQGPVGRFVNSSLDTPLAFVATGVGLAPIIGIIEDELKNKTNQQSIQLLFGVRSELDMFWTERLDALQNHYPTFKYILALSQPSKNWHGRRGRVTEYANELNSTADFFLCGSPDMVKDVRGLLMASGVTAGRIKLEVF